MDQDGGPQESIAILCRDGRRKSLSVAMEGLIEQTVVGMVVTRLVWAQISKMCCCKRQHGVDEIGVLLGLLTDGQLRVSQL